MSSTETRHSVGLTLLRLSSLKRTFQNLTFLVGNLNCKISLLTHTGVWVPVAEGQVPGPDLAAVDEIARVGLHSHEPADGGKLTRSVATNGLVRKFNRHFAINSP